MKRHTITAVCSALLLALALSGCGESGGEAYEAAADEIALQIQLSLQEDIGLLLIDYEGGTSAGGGGTSHADKSLIKRDERIIYTLSEREFDSPSDVENLTLRFTVITEYVDPNYENVYPEEYTKPAGEITLRAGFGESYSVVITGGNADGYTVALAE